MEAISKATTKILMPDRVIVVIGSLREIDYVLESNVRFVILSQVAYFDDDGDRIDHEKIEVSVNKDHIIRMTEEKKK